MNAIARLASAIGYPQAVPADSADFTFKVDDGDVRVLDLGGRMVLTREISRNADDLPGLAEYAAGRMLREEALLYWDGRAEAAVLAQEIDAAASPHAMRFSFEEFANSCDWWLARMAAAPVDSLSFPEMVIRP